MVISHHVFRERAPWRHLIQPSALQRLHVPNRKSNIDVCVFSKCHISVNRCQQEASFWSTKSSLSNQISALTQRKPDRSHHIWGTGEMEGLRSFIDTWFFVTQRSDQSASLKGSPEHQNRRTEKTFKDLRSLRLSLTSPCWCWSYNLIHVAPGAAPDQSRCCDVIAKLKPTLKTLE